MRDIKNVNNNYLQYEGAFTRALKLTRPGYGISTEIPYQWGERVCFNVNRAKGIGGIATMGGALNKVDEVIFPQNYFSEIPIVSIQRMFSPEYDYFFPAGEKEDIISTDELHRRWVVEHQFNFINKAELAVTKDKFTLSFVYNSAYITFPSIIIWHAIGI